MAENKRLKNNSLIILVKVKGHYKRNDTLVYSTDVTESRQNWMVLCSTFTGLMDGREIVARGCFRGFRELVGVCSRDVYLEIEGRNATDVVGCFCSGDRCNNASDVQITCLSLIAITMHIMYKFVTV